MKITKYCYRIILLSILFILFVFVSNSQAINPGRNWYCAESGQKFLSYQYRDWKNTNTVTKTSEDGKAWHALRIYCL